MKTAINPDQLSLLPPEVTSAIEGVFGHKQVKNAKGAIVGTAIGLISRKEIAEKFGLKGKENKDALDAQITGIQDDAWTKVKAGLVALPKDFTLHSLRERVTASGERQITIVTREKKRNSGPSDDVIAAKLGWTVEQVRDLREKQEAKLKAGIVDIPATTNTQTRQAA